MSRSPKSKRFPPHSYKFLIHFVFIVMTYSYNVLLFSHRERNWLENEKRLYFLCPVCKVFPLLFPHRVKEKKEGIQPARSSGLPYSFKMKLFFSFYFSKHGGFHFMPCILIKQRMSPHVNNFLFLASSSPTHYLLKNFKFYFYFNFPAYWWAWVFLTFYLFMLIDIKFWQADMEKSQV